MKKIEISEKTYGKLLELKNHISTKTRTTISIEGNPSTKKADYEPEYKFDEMLDDIIDMIWYEQESGNVAEIT